MKTATITGATGIGKSFIIKRLMNKIEKKAILIDCIQDNRPKPKNIPADTEILIIDHVSCANDPQQLMLDSISHCNTNNIDVILVDQDPEDFFWEPLGCTANLEMNFKGGFKDLKIELVTNNKTTTFTLKFH